MGFAVDVVHQFREHNLRRFAKVIFDKGAKYPNIIGFIDNTLQSICRPYKKHEAQKKKRYYIMDESILYIHDALKYQSIVIPGRTTSSILGPFVGSRHDLQV